MQSIPNNKFCRLKRQLFICCNPSATLFCQSDHVTLKIQTGWPTLHEQTRSATLNNKIQTIGHVLKWTIAYILQCDRCVLNIKTVKSKYLNCRVTRQSQVLYTVVQTLSFFLKFVQRCLYIKFVRSCTNIKMSGNPTLLVIFNKIKENFL